ncbi:MAG: hypothetical protein ACREC5_05450 [Thermoplasmata archaeon]
MTPDQAVREILRIEGHSESLLHRTIGLTWMIWAVIDGGIFVSYEAIGFAAPTGPIAISEYGLAWLPWVLLGSIATTILWRSLALVLPRDAGSASGVTAVATVTFLALVLGGLAVVALANVPVSPPAWAMFAIGIAAAVVGGSGLTTDSRPERTFWLVGGALLAILTVGISLLAGRIGYDPLGLFLVVGPVASTALLFGGGLYTVGS